jgi:hypothetical protein
MILAAHRLPPVRKAHPSYFCLPVAQDSEASILLATHTEGARGRPLW